MPSPKIIWVRSDHLPSYDERKKIVSSALEAGYVQILIREEDAELRRLGRYDALVLKGMSIFLEEERVGEIVQIRSNEDLARASALKGRVENVLIEAKDWKVIPLENLIADFQGSSTKLLATATSPEEAKLFLETLEVGVGGVAIEPSSASRLRDFHVIHSDRMPKVELTKAMVSKIAPAGVGDRVCLDTCSLLRVGEGMLIGSQSACLFLVSSESLESEYVASRPFRVNAGAVHAYALMPTGKTRYLSEVKSGDEVLAIDSEGRCRTVVVGRSKIERRPLLLLEAKVGDRRFTTILQNAETIRLCTPSGPVSISDLKVGQEVLVRLEEGGRHFGQAISETITEL
ncbi:MAG: 3-dehydroquinate synthase II [Methanomassiliicoccales archaeon]|nr:3-dehydroquinate synthase II [Methanomassiliicoccales archaeon]MDD1757014.1 3-dehydroquinate synthase II [Methanomassiliicoccales archaeon]